MKAMQRCKIDTVAASCRKKSIKENEQQEPWRWTTIARGIRIYELDIIEIRNEIIPLVGEEYLDCQRDTNLPDNDTIYSFASVSLGQYRRSVAVNIVSQQGLYALCNRIVAWCKLSASVRLDYFSCRFVGYAHGDSGKVGLKKCGLVSFRSFSLKHQLQNMILIRAQCNIVKTWAFGNAVFGHLKLESCTTRLRTEKRYERSLQLLMLEIQGTPSAYAMIEAWRKLLRARKRSECLLQLIIQMCSENVLTRQRDATSC